MNLTMSILSKMPSQSEFCYQTMPKTPIPVYDIMTYDVVKLNVVNILLSVTTVYYES